MANLASPLALQVIAAAKAQIPQLQHGGYYLTKHICGPMLWKSLKKSERIHAGIILSAAVNQGLLPLQRGKTKANNHQVYCLQ